MLPEEEEVDLPEDDEDDDEDEDDDVDDEPEDDDVDLPDDTEDDEDDEVPPVDPEAPEVPADDDLAAAAAPCLVVKDPLDALVLGFTLVPGTCLFSNAPVE